MAGLFGVGGPFGPISPGMSGAVNPLAIIGAGMYQNNPLGALQTMGNLQQSGMQIQQQQLQNQMAMRRHQQQMELRRQAMEAELAEKERQRRAAKLMVPALLGTMAPNVAEEQLEIMRQGLEAQAEAFPGAISAAGLEAMMPAEAEPPKISDISGLRKEYSKESATWKSTRDAFERIEASQPTGAGDISLLTGYMKILDPGSTVREGEFATAANAGGVSNQIRGLYNSVVKGERLTPEMRAQFKSQAGEFLSRQRDLQLRREGVYQGIATRAGMLRADTVPDYLGRYREGVPTFEAPEPEAGSPLPVTETQSEAFRKYAPPYAQRGAR